MPGNRSETIPLNNGRSTDVNLAMFMSFILSRSNSSSYRNVKVMQKRHNYCESNPGPAKVIPNTVSVII